MKESQIIESTLKEDVARKVGGILSMKGNREMGECPETFSRSRACLSRSAEDIRRER